MSIMRKRLALIILAAVLLAFSVAAVRGITLVGVIKHYPSVYVANTAGCTLNYDIGWTVRDPRGDLVLQTQDETEAALALLVCE